jgi:hypothetical protein
MPLISSNRHFNDPLLAQGFSNLAQLFAPPSGGDAAGYETAKAKRAEADRLAQFFNYMKNPGFNREYGDRLGVGAGVYAPDQSYYSIDQGQVRPPLPGDIASMYGLPEIASAQGLPKALSETEVKGQERQDLRDRGLLTDQVLLDAITSDIPVEPVVGSDGRTAELVRRGNSVGRQPAPTPNTVINTGPNGIDYGEPENGLAWARNADGTVKLDQRGAPIALPYQGGSVYNEQQAAEARGASRAEDRAKYADVVTEDIDRAIGAIEKHPRLTTGIGGQWTSGVGGTPGRNVQALIDTVKSNVGFDKLQEMRLASPRPPIRCTWRHIARRGAAGSRLR